MSNKLKAWGSTKTGHNAIISKVGRQRQEDQNFKASLGYMRQKRGGGLSQWSGSQRSTELANNAERPVNEGAT